MTEQFVAQQLKAADRELYYFSTKNSTGEIDFLIQQDMQCIPIEVKAEENLRAKSLKAFCENYRQQEWMINVPLYMLDEFLCKMPFEIL